MRTDFGFWEIVILIAISVSVGCYIGRKCMENEIVEDCKKYTTFVADKNVYKCGIILNSEITGKVMP